MKAAKWRISCLIRSNLAQSFAEVKMNVNAKARYYFFVLLLKIYHFHNIRITHIINMYS